MSISHYEIVIRIDAKDGEERAKTIAESLIRNRGDMKAQVLKVTSVTEPREERIQLYELNSYHG